MNIVDELNSRFLTQDLVSQQDGLSAAELENTRRLHPVMRKWKMQWPC